jgi:hypothetical protein
MRSSLHIPGYPKAHLKPCDCATLSRAKSPKGIRSFFSFLIFFSVHCFFFGWGPSACAALLLLGTRSPQSSLIFIFQIKSCALWVKALAKVPDVCPHMLALLEAFISSTQHLLFVSSPREVLPPRCLAILTIPAVNDAVGFREKVLVDERDDLAHATQIAEARQALRDRGRSVSKHTHHTNR